MFIKMGGLRGRLAGVAFSRPLAFCVSFRRFFCVNFREAMMTCERASNSCGRVRLEELEQRVMLSAAPFPPPEHVIIDKSAATDMATSVSWCRYRWRWGYRRERPERVEVQPLHELRFRRSAGLILSLSKGVAALSPSRSTAPADIVDDDLIAAAIPRH